MVWKRRKLFANLARSCRLLPRRVLCSPNSPYSLPIRARARPGRIGRGCAEQTDRLEPPGRRSGCWSTSPFLFSGLLFADSGRRWSSGDRWRSLAPAAQRATGSSTTDRKICSTDSGGACSRSRSAAATAALNDHQNLAEFTFLAALTRAREARADSASCEPSCAEQTDRLEPAGRRCGCWPTSPFLFSGIVVRRVRGDDGARAIDGDRRSTAAGASAASYGVIDNDRKICSTDSGGACSRSRSAAATAALNDHQNLAALTYSLPLRARE